jgi:SMP-30/Gluconolactonase/LRE-like region
MLFPFTAPGAAAGDYIAVTAHTVYVADAGANSVVSVDLGSGKTRTVAVLPPRPFKITTADTATAAVGLPACVAGRTYAFEPVPTDVAVGPDGRLYVTSLPGGPEGPQLGARGAVFKVDPDNGRVKLVADGILSPSGLALDEDGTSTWPRSSATAWSKSTGTPDGRSSCSPLNWPPA